MYNITIEFEIIDVKEKVTVEQYEVTKADNTLEANVRVAREWLLALPHELSDDKNKALVL